MRALAVAVIVAVEVLGVRPGGVSPAPRDAVFTGHGSVGAGSAFIDAALPCRTGRPARLEITSRVGRFHLTDLELTTCTRADPRHPSAGQVQTGSGGGLAGGRAATASWTLRIADGAPPQVSFLVDVRGDETFGDAGPLTTGHLAVTPG